MIDYHAYTDVTDKLSVTVTEMLDGMIPERIDNYLIRTCSEFDSEQRSLFIVKLYADGIDGTSKSGVSYQFDLRNIRDCYDSDSNVDEAVGSFRLAKLTKLVEQTAKELLVDLIWQIKSHRKTEVTEQGQ